MYPTSAAGPPNPMVPSLRKYRTSSPHRSRRGCGDAVVQQDAQPAPALCRALVDEDRRSHVLQGGAGRVENEDLVLAGAAGTTSGDNRRQLAVDILLGHLLCLDRVMKIAACRARGQRVDDHAAVRKRVGVDFLFRGIVGPDRSHEQSGVQMARGTARAAETSCR